LIAFLVLGYFCRPYVDSLVPGQMPKKTMPELGEIYSASAQFEDAIRNPVIVVPGMMGSRLQDSATGRTVWGVFGQESIDTDSADDVRLMACPIDGTDLNSFEDGVWASGVLDSLEINIAGLELSHQAYLNILRMLGVGGYRDQEGDATTPRTHADFMSFCLKRKPTLKSNGENDLAIPSQ